MTAQARNIPDEDEIFLVDGSGYIFRAYYAVPQNLTNPQGVPVGAVLGFCNMMVKLLKDLQAPYVAVIFDAARKNFRYDIYPEYKANRSETPEDLVPQFGLIREATRAFGLPALEMEGFEADDLIATYAREALAQGKKVTIVGSDKDLMQLIREGVRMYEPIKGRYLTLEDVQDKFGVTPDKVPDVQALVGDSSDNVPGVPSIGAKTAAQLINEYGSLEELLARLDEIKQPKRRDVLTENAEIARISKQLVTLRDDVPLPITIDEMHTHSLNTPELAAFLQTQGFKSVMTRLNVVDAPKPATIAPYEGATEARVTPAAENQNNLPDPCHNQYFLIQDTQTLKDLVARAYETGMLAVDTETTGLTPAKAKLVGICLSAELGKGYYIPVGHMSAPQDLLSAPVATNDLLQIPLAEAISILKPVLEDPRVLKIGHNMKYDWQMLAKHGVRTHPVDDTMLMSYVLDGSNHGHGMDELATLLCNHTTITYEEVTGKGRKQITFDQVPLDQARDYAAEDAEITLRLYHILKPRLAQEQCTRIYEDVERPIIPVIAEMELAGIRVDPVVLKQLSHEFGMKLVALEQDIYKLAGHEFNVASPKQMGVVLFEEMGLTGGSKTKGGDWSTAADVLEDLQEHEIVAKIMEWRQLSKLKSTYTDSLQEQINPDTGRVHTSFHMTGTNTGRLSSTDPNLQNIPIRTEEGRRIRKAFVAEKGHKLLSVDYSQVELRLAAELAGVKALQQAFRDKVDIHTLTASQVFGVPLDQVTPDLRRSAKAVNFGIIYGISGWGLAKQLGVTPGEANQFITAYLKNFREIQDYMEARKQEARDQGFVKTLYGRKCMIGYIHSKMQGQRLGAERQAINAPLQGTAADIMKMAMARMPKALNDAGLKARMLLQVHDELVFEVPDDELEETAIVVKRVMENVANLNVPLEAEAGFADNWSEAH